MREPQRILAEAMFQDRLLTDHGLCVTNDGSVVEVFLNFGKNRLYIKVCGETDQIEISEISRNYGDSCSWLPFAPLQAIAPVGVFMFWILCDEYGQRDGLSFEFIAEEGQAHPYKFDLIAKAGTLDLYFSTAIGISS